MQLVRGSWEKLEGKVSVYARYDGSPASFLRGQGILPQCENYSDLVGLLEKHPFIMGFSRVDEEKVVGDFNRAISSSDVGRKSYIKEEVGFYTCLIFGVGEKEIRKFPGDIIFAGEFVQPDKALIALRLASHFYYNLYRDKPQPKVGEVFSLNGFMRKYGLPILQAMDMGDEFYFDELFNGLSDESPDKAVVGEMYRRLKGVGLGPGDMGVVRKYGKLLRAVAANDAKACAQIRTQLMGSSNARVKNLETGL
jgi:hypothetical protein